MKAKLVEFWSKRLCRKHVAFAVTGLLLVGGVIALAVSANEVVRARPFSPALNGYPQELRLELGSNGFTPSSVQRAAGTFDITIENSAISGEYTLRLKAEDGTIVKEVSVQKGSVGWTVTLQAGVYTLMEVSNPQWQCQITVQ